MAFCLKEKKPGIIAIGLNPAWQKILIFDKIRQGEVNRARRILSYPSGKAINFARASCGFSVPELFQFAGGGTGKMLIAGVEKEKIRHFTVNVGATTRTCVTCIETSDNTITELIEPSAEIRKNESEKLLKAIFRKIPSSDGVAICGTFPPGVNSDFYAGVANFAKKLKCPVLLDSYKDIGKVLEAGVTILKINASEIKDITGEKTAKIAALKLLRRYEIEFVAVTDGAKPAQLFSRNDHVILGMPKIKVLNSIGSGDTASAIFFSRFLQEINPVEAFREAIAAASANCLTYMPGKFSISMAEKLLRQIKNLTVT